MQRKSIRFLAATMLIGIGVAARASTLHIELETLFQGNHSMSGTQPISVTLENDGPDAKGVLTVSSGSFSMQYPVELPQGTKKRLTTYPKTEYYSQITATLDTDHGSAIKSLGIPFDGQQDDSTVLLIGDQPGSLAFIQNSQNAQNSRPAVGFRGASGPAPYAQIRDSYCTPSDAPPREVGYAGIKAIFLGSGAERISDGAVEALKSWTLQGGMLVFVGGASSPVLSDARWNGLIPATKFSPKTISGSETLTTLGASPFPLNQSFTTLQPLDMKGAAVRADGDTVLTAEKGFGLGRVVLMTFNPFEAPLNHWDGRAHAVGEIIRQGLIPHPELGVGDFSSQSDSATPVIGAGSGPAPGKFGFESDPFSTKLPPAGQVFGLLAAYFIAVVPLNFLILRKFKKGELAWFTAPILSLGFASVLFKSADHLYNNQLSTATQGTLIFHPGASKGVFVGASEIFIPKAGHYDLGMTGIDSIGTLEDNPYNYRTVSESNTLELNAVDNGQITVPNLLASNLAFKQLVYRQQVPNQDEYSISMHREGPYAVCELKNGSSTTLERVNVNVGKRRVLVGDMKAGETREVKVDLTKPIGGGIQDSWLGSELNFDVGAAMDAQLTDFRPGPQIGQLVSARSHITLLVFSKDSLGGTR